MQEEEGLKIFFDPTKSFIRKPEKDLTLVGFGSHRSYILEKTKIPMKLLI